MTFEEFKVTMFTLVRVIVEKGDRNGATYKAQIDKLSADLTLSNQNAQESATGLAAANSKIQELVAALAAKDMELATALASAQAAEIAKASALADANAITMAQLDTLSTELQTAFNPTSTADAVAEAVAESPAIETPVIVEEATTIGTNEATPPQVIEAAIEAIAEMEVPEDEDEDEDEE